MEETVTKGGFFVSDEFATAMQEKKDRATLEQLSLAQGTLLRSIAYIEEHYPLSLSYSRELLESKLLDVNDHISAIQNRLPKPSSRWKRFWDWILVRDTTVAP
jgi:hypothetical protein